MRAFEEDPIYLKSRAPAGAAGAADGKRSVSPNSSSAARIVRPWWRYASFLLAAGVGGYFLAMQALAYERMRFRTADSYSSRFIAKLEGKPLASPRKCETNFSKSDSGREPDLSWTSFLALPRGSPLNEDHDEPAADTASFECPFNTPQFRYRPEMFAAFIRESLRFWHGKRQVTTEALKQAFEFSKAMYLFRVKNGKLSYRIGEDIAKRGVTYDAEASLIGMLTLVAEAAGLPDTAFILNPFDWPASNWADVLPVFSWVTDEAHSDIPTPGSLIWGDGMHECKETTATFECPKTFSERKGAAWWRGTLTGPTQGYRSALMPFYPRIRAGIVSAENPSLVDASLGGVSPQGLADLAAPTYSYHETVTRLAPHVAEGKVERECEYRYHLLVAGNTAVGRLPRLMTRGVLIWPSFPWREHYYFHLIPGKDFVPAKRDLSDVPALVRWLKENPSEAEKIHRSGKAKIRELVNREAFLCYWYHLLTEWSRSCLAADFDFDAL